MYIKQNIQRIRKQHNLIYKITNIRNGMIYIGKHETDNVDDGYIGSGTYLKIAYYKEGPKNFKKEILFDFPTREEMLKKEKELVNPAFVLDPNTYNLAEGGISNPIVRKHKWIHNKKIKIQHYVNADHILTKEQIDDGWEYGQLKKADVEYLLFNGQNLLVSEWAKKFNVNSSQIFERRNKNWTNEEIFTIPFEYGLNKQSKEQRKLARTKELEIKRKLKSEQNLEKCIEQANSYLEEFKNNGCTAEYFKKKYGKSKTKCILSKLRLYSEEYRNKWMKSSTKPLYIEFNGVKQSLSKWMSNLGLANWAFYDLIAKGYSKEDAIKELFLKKSKNI